MALQPGTGYTGADFQDAVLNSTNLYRSEYQVEPLEWDDDLASYAEDYAKDCIWEHSGGEYGENLAQNYATPTLAIDAWADEESMYDYGKAKFGEKTGHFTQLVWQNTTKVGCGAVECNNDAKNGAKGWFVVCEYDPAGNVIGEFEANVRKAGDGGGNGDLGLGEDDENAGVRVSGSGRLLVALVAVSLVVGMFSW